MGSHALQDGGGVLPLCQLRFLLVGREWRRDNTRQGCDQELGELPDVSSSPCSPSTEEDEEDGMTTDLTKGIGSGGRCHPTEFLLSTKVAFHDNHRPLPIPGLPDLWSACLPAGGGNVVAQDRADPPGGTSAPGTISRYLLCFPWAVLLSAGSLATCPVL